MSYPLTVGQRAAVDSDPQTLKRYLTYVPRIVVWSGQVNGSPLVDSETGGIYGFPYDGAVGVAADASIGYTIEIGTVAGARDVGVFRLRKAIDTGASTIYVNETSQAIVPVQNNHYITIITQRRIWQKRIRRVITASDPPEYDEFIDYDIAYNQSNEDLIPPIANITKYAEIVADVIHVQQMGFTDPGETFRLVKLYAGYSNGLGISLDVDGFIWDIKDCTLVGGGLDVIFVWLEVPIGHREISLTVVTTTGGSQIRYLDLWTFEDEDDSLLIKEFFVDSDSRQEGREMAFTIWDEKAVELPEGSRIGYFEVPYFDGLPIPEQYVGEFTGWVEQDSILFRLYRSVYRVSVGGPQWWLNKLGGYPQTVYDQRTPETPDLVATAYTMFPANYYPKLLHYILRIYTNALELMNFYPNVGFIPVEGYTSTDGSIWSQLVAIGERYFAYAACDSYGALWVKRVHSYLSQADRDLIPDRLTLVKSDWTDDNAPSFSEDKYEKVAYIEMYGSNYQISFPTPTSMETFSHVWRVAAPSLTQGDGVGKDSGPTVFLENGSGALQTLKNLVGDHLARLNNRIPDVNIPLMKNMDVIEPAWGYPISVTYADPNVRDISYITEKFLVKSVSVSHSNERSKPPKQITWNIEKITKGLPGVEIPDVLQKQDVLPIPLSDGVAELGEWTGAVPINGMILSYAEAKAAKLDTFDMITGIATYLDRSTGLTVPSVHGRSDPFNYFRAFNLDVDGNLWKMEDFEVGGTWEVVATPTQIFGNGARRGYKFLMSHMRQGWIMVLSGWTGAAVSFDYGATWAQVALDGGTPNWGTNHDRGLAGGDAEICGRDADHIRSITWAGSPVSNFNTYESIDGGLTFALVPQIAQAYNGGGLASAMTLSIPYTKAGGAPNLDDGNLELYTMAESGNGASPQSAICKSSDGGATYTAVLTSGGIGANYKLSHAMIGGAALTQFTHDATYQLLSGRDSGDGGFGSRIRRTIDDYGSMPPDAILAQAGGSAFYNGMNGWSMNENVYVTWSRVSGYELSDDGGVTWVQPSLPIGWTTGIAYVEYSLYPFITARG